MKSRVRHIEGKALVWITRSKFLGIAIVIVMAALGGGPVPALSAQQVTVTLATSPWIGYGPWSIAKDKAIDQKYGVRLNPINLRTHQDYTSGFVSGRVDGGNMSANFALTLLDNKVPFTVVLIEDASYTADAIVAGAGIKSIKDLVGKKVAFEDGSTSDILIRNALAKNSLSLKDIQHVSMPASDAGAALLAGRVDAAVTYEPYISAALGQGKGYKIIYSGADDPGLISDVLVLHNGFLQKHNDVAVSLARIWDEAVNFLDKDPASGRKIIADAVQADPAKLKSAFDGLKFYNIRESADQLAPGGKYIQAMSSILDILVQQGSVKQRFSFERNVSDQFAKAAAK